MSEIEILEQLGFSEAESKVYLALIETGSTLAGAVIKKTGLHRGTTYQILQRLKEKGVVSSIIKGRKQYFEAASPERLLDTLKEKENNLKSIIPALKAKILENKEKQEVVVYSGTKGIRSVFDKMLEEIPKGREYYDFGVSGLFKETMPSYWEFWQKQKRKNKIKSFVIFNEKIKESNPELLKSYYGEKRFNPKEFSSFTDTIIYNDTVILFIWTASPPIAVVIKNKDNALSYLNQFKLMWKTAKK